MPHPLQSKGTSSFSGGCWLHGGGQNTSKKSDLAATVVCSGQDGGGGPTEVRAGTHLGQTRMEGQESGPEIDVSKFRYARPLPAGEAGPAVLSPDVATLAVSGPSGAPGIRLWAVR